METIRSQFCNMRAEDIIREIERLPIPEKMAILERRLKSIRENRTKRKMEEAANALQRDYETDNELTAFTDLDLENFYVVK